jgi:hypothetical protein
MVTPKYDSDVISEIYGETNFKESIDEKKGAPVMGFLWLKANSDT